MSSMLSMSHFDTSVNLDCLTVKAVASSSGLDWGNSMMPIKGDCRKVVKTNDP